MDPKQFRQIIKEEVTEIVQTELEPIKETLGEHTKRLETVENKLSGVDKRLERVEEKVDALSGDVEQLHDDVKGIRDTEGLFHSRNKREIDEIKTHIWFTSNARRSRNRAFFQNMLGMGNNNQKYDVSNRSIHWTTISS